jgi:hypothetical protein
LVKDCSKVEHVVAEGDALPEFDLYAPLLSLPAILGTTPSNVPADVPYLWPAPRLVEHWQNELSALNGFKIGVAWQGNPTYAGDAQRSIPLKLFKSLADIEGVNLISLQRGAGVEQLQKLAGAFPILDLGERLDVEAGAFMDTAALMKSLDLVISSDTALPHLAGALGLPVWVALPLVPDWRWMLQRDDSPWYPTMRLFRQSSYGQWHEVFKRMAEELKPTLATWQNKKSESRA